MGKLDPWPYIDAITKLAAFATATYPLLKAAWEKLKAVWRKIRPKR